jgi:hypothetical protein
MSAERHTVHHSAIAIKAGAVETILLVIGSRTCSRRSCVVNNDRINHLSYSHNRNSPSYSFYSQDCVDGECWISSPRRWYRSRALVVPTKSTETGSTTFPILTTGTVLLTLSILKIVSTEKVKSVVIVVRTDAALTTTLPSRRRQGRPPFRFSQQELSFLLSRLCSLER